MTSFTYTTGIPNPPNNPSADVPNMQQNTNSINSILAIDHVSFNTAQGGTHNQVQLQVTPGTSPPSGILASTNTIYSQVAGSAPLGPLGEVFYTRGGSGTGIQLTGPGTPTPSANGYTFLPGGIMLQWGTSAVNMSGTLTTINFTPNFPNACFGLTIIGIQNSASASPAANNVFLTNSAGNPSKSNFIVSNSSGILGGVTKIFWMAIGN